LDRQKNLSTYAPYQYTKILLFCPPSQTLMSVRNRINDPQPTSRCRTRTSPLRSNITPHSRRMLHQAFLFTLISTPPNAPIFQPNPKTSKPSKSSFTNLILAQQIHGHNRLLAITRHLKCRRLLVVVMRCPVATMRLVVWCFCGWDEAGGWCGPGPG
jgi:hypothetical protein